MATDMPLALRAYQIGTHLIPLVAKRHIKKRLATGKEHKTRAGERLGQPTQDRPAGQLIWLHAVGLGEVLSLRGLIQMMASHTDANFLITSGTRAAAAALEKNTPPRTIHQFLPLDAPPYRRAFLDHWQPDLCIWAEQDLWPGFVIELAKRNVPQAMAVVRMTAKSAHKKHRFSSSYTYLCSQMAHITAYDTATQDHLDGFGFSAVPVTGSIKPTAPPLGHDPAELANLKAVLGDRFVWIVAPSHPPDETLALEAHTRILKDRPDALLIIAPRDPNRSVDIPLPHAIRSQGSVPKSKDSVYLADTFGELGLFYRVAQVALIGGTNNDIEGHSPWEAANLNNAVLHGPRVTNFQKDFVTLDAANGARLVTNAAEIAQALRQDHDDQITNAKRVIETYRQATNALAIDLLTLL